MSFELTSPPVAKASRVRRGGWSWGPVEGAKLRALSFGGGVQSTTLVEMMIAGDLPWVDAIIFSNPGDESTLTLEHIDAIERRVRLASNQVQFLRVSQGGRLSDRLRRRASGEAGYKKQERFVSIPAFTANGGQGKRQCTRDFKIDPLEKEHRRLLGYKPRQRIPAGTVEVWIGISTDEVVRAGAAFSRWAVNRYPLLEQRMSRGDCIQWLKARGLVVPPKSACVFCPYRTNAEWRFLRDNDPEGWQQALEIDALIRETPGMRFREFLHDSRKPLADADISSDEERGQGMLNICEAGCGL